MEKITKFIWIDFFMIGNYSYCLVLRGLILHKTMNLTDPYNATLNMRLNMNPHEIQI